MVKASKQPPRQPETEGAQVTFGSATCLYRGPGGEEARVFRAGEPVPAASEGWQEHPSLCPPKEPTP